MTAAPPPSAAEDQLLAAVREHLAAHADPARAPAMRAYLKSDLPVLGVPRPMIAKLSAVFAAHPLADRAAYERVVTTLWCRPAWREERYAAIALTGDRRYRPYQDPDALAGYREMVVTGAWWDLVDEVASRRVGPILRAFPEQVRPVMLDWAVDADRWTRRTAIICQLGAGPATDTGLLRAAVQANVDDRDFFIRKAIGWALRQYARTDPRWVVATVGELGDRLSGLSRREALKHVTGSADAAGGDGAAG